MNTNSAMEPRDEVDAIKAVVTFYPSEEYCIPNCDPLLYRTAVSVIFDTPGKGREVLKPWKNIVGSGGGPQGYTAIVTTDAPDPVFEQGLGSVQLLWLEDICQETGFFIQVRRPPGVPLPGEPVARREGGNDAGKGCRSP